MSKSGRITILVRIVVAGSILAFLFSKIPFHSVYQALRSASLGYFLLAFAIQPALVYIQSVRMRLMTRQQDMNFTVSSIYKIYLVNSFYLLFLPGGISGNLVLWYKLSAPKGMRAQAFASIVLAKTLQIVSMASLGIIFFLIDLPPEMENLSLILVVMLGASVGLLTLVMKWKVTRETKRFFGVFHWPFFLRDKGRKIWDSLKLFRKFPKIVAASVGGFSLLYELGSVISIFIIAISLGINIPFVTIAWIHIMVKFMEMLPFSFFGLGIREGGFVFMLGLFSVSPEKAMALSLVNFGYVIFFASLGGILEGERVFLRKLIHKS